MTLQDHHRIIREGAAIGAVSPRRQIAVVGKDRAAYLQGLLTNDIEALRPGTGCYAAWLTPQELQPRWLRAISHQVVHIQCTCDPELAAQRFLQRKRHQGHCRAKNSS